MATRKQYEALCDATAMSLVGWYTPQLSAPFGTTPFVFTDVACYGGMRLVGLWSPSFGGREISCPAWV